MTYIIGSLGNVPILRFCGSCPLFEGFTAWGSRIVVLESVLLAVCSSSQPLASKGCFGGVFIYECQPLNGCQPVFV